RGAAGRAQPRPRRPALPHLAPRRPPHGPPAHRAPPRRPPIGSRPRAGTPPGPAPPLAAPGQRRTLDPPLLIVLLFSPLSPLLPGVLPSGVRHARADPQPHQGAPPRPRRRPGPPRAELPPPPRTAARRPGGPVPGGRLRPQPACLRAARRPPEAAR